jgi:hypothetical protein
MTAKVFTLDTQPGIQRDGTVFDKMYYNDGEWVRFQRGRPRKVGGFRVISDQLTGPSRGIWVNPQNAFTSIFSGYNNGLQVLTIDNNGVGAGIGDFTLANFTASNLNLWQFDGFYDVGGNGVQSLVAHPGQDLTDIGSETNTPVLIGDITGLNMSQVGVFTATGSTTNLSSVVTMAAINTLIGAGQTVTGAGIPANTTVVSASLVSTTDTLAGVAVTGTAGQFSCSATTLLNDQQIVVTGTLTGTATGISPGTYYIIATNGTTTFTLSKTSGGSAIVTTAGTTAGLVFVVQVSSIWTVVLSNTATATATVTLTFNNNISVSGGVVALHPYLFVYGNNGLIQNCSAGNTNDWVSADANATNVASGKVVQGLPVRGGSNAPSGLFWTLDSLVRVSYIGGQGTPPQYWRYDIISSQSSILSSQSVIEYDGVYYWCGTDRFLLYNGVVKEIPNTMNQNYFFDNLNYDQRQKVWVTKVPRFGEIWWFYPRGDATECTDAIIYNVRENTWYDAGEARGAQRSAGYFSQVFAYPVAADWHTSEAETVFTGTFDEVTGSVFLYSDTYNTQVALRQVISGSNIPTGTTVVAITSSNIKTLGAITPGSGYVNGSYTNVTLTGGTGSGAKATIGVAGGQVTTLTITARGAGYLVGDVLSATAASLGGTGAGFSIPVTAIYLQAIQMSAAATGTGSVSLTFSIPANLIEVYQHEIGTDDVNGQNVRAILSSFETNDLSWLGGGPSSPATEGNNRWLRIERVEPDFLQTGEMSVVVTGRPFAQGEDKESDPYVFGPNTGKIDMREQRRELRLRFISDVAGGNYQLGKVLLNAEVGDVRPYGP